MAEERIGGEGGSGASWQGCRLCLCVRLSTVRILFFPSLFLTTPSFPLSSVGFSPGVLYRSRTDEYAHARPSTARTDAQAHTPAPPLRFLRAAASLFSPLRVSVRSFVCAYSEPCHVFTEQPRGCLFASSPLSVQMFSVLLNHYCHCCPPLSPDSL